MYRTQILLKEKQYEFLKRLSEEEKKSISQILREIIESYSKKSKVYSLSSLAGILEDTESDGGDHDKWIYNKK
ncbi:MAG: ribbon-helix-helix protein, CopG family [Nitrospinae bacterium]|nr:ribbon-helix-helix protein, CopG family [Nitrospinota bacterium]